MVNYARHRAAIEKLYEDRATIKRNVEVTAPNKATRVELQTIYSDQPCRLSQKQLATNGQTDAQNDIRYETKLFIAPELELQQGDMLEVTRGRNTAAGWEPIAPMRKYEAGEPFPYVTHQEISIQRKEWA